MSKEAPQADITRKQIMARLDQLGVEYKPNMKRDVLLDLLNSAIATPSESTPDEGDGSVSSDSFNKRASKQGAESPVRDSRDIAIANEAAKTAKRDEKIIRMLKTKGYKWYVCEARTVLDDRRVCRQGMYYPIHSNEVARVGTYAHKTGKFDKQGIEQIVRRPRFKKQTPKQGAEIRKQAELEEFDANHFVG